MIQIIYDKIIDFCGVANVPCVIVGSKKDLDSRCLPSARFTYFLTSSAVGK